MGQLVWANTYGGPAEVYGIDLRGLGSAGAIAVGISDSLGTGDTDALVVRLDAVGGVIWARTLGKIGADQAQAVDTIPGGGFILSASMQYTTASSTACLARFTSDGDTAWVRRYDVPFLTLVRVRPRTDGGFIAVGQQFPNASGGTPSMVLLKVDAAGVTQWCRSYGLGFGADVAPLAAGGYLIGGHMNDQLIAISVNEQGGVEWARGYQVPGNVYMKNMHVRPAGFTITGYTHYGPMLESLVVMDLQMDGTLNWVNGIADVINITLVSSIGHDNGSTMLLSSRPGPGIVGFDMMLVAVDGDGSPACNAFDIMIEQQDLSLAITAIAAPSIRGETFRELELSVTEAAPTETPLCLGNGLDGVPQKQPLSVVPNPAREVLHVSVPEAEPFDVELLSSTGQVALAMRSYPGPDASIALQDIASGIYLLRIRTLNASHTRIVVVE
jgi:hypothetical protein